MLASKLRFAGIAAASLTLIGCVANSEKSSASPPLPTGSWTLTTIENQPLPNPLPPGLRPITLTISDAGDVSGNAGINRYSGTVDTGAWENREIVFGPLAVSRMAGPPAAMTAECGVQIFFEFWTPRGIFKDLSSACKKRDHF